MISWRNTWDPNTNDYSIDIQGVVNHSDVEGKAKLVDVLKNLIKCLEPSGFDVAAEAAKIQERWKNAVVK